MLTLVNAVSGFLGIHYTPAAPYNATHNWTSSVPKNMYAQVQQAQLIYLFNTQAKQTCQVSFRCTGGTMCSTAQHSAFQCSRPCTPYGLHCKRKTRSQTLHIALAVFEACDTWGLKLRTNLALVLWFTGCNTLHMQKVACMPSRSNVRGTSSLPAVATNKCLTTFCPIAQLPANQVSDSHAQHSIAQGLVSRDSKTQHSIAWLMVYTRVNWLRDQSSWKVQH